MAQRTKLIIAALATALLTAVGTAGASTGVLDAKQDTTTNFTGGAWCC
jgi:hypothetical protein